MDVTDLVLRWIHILSAIAMVGGAIFWRAVWVPTAATLDADTRKSVFEAMRPRWSRIVMLGTLLLLVTGLLNAVRIIGRYEFIEAPSYHMLVALKFGLALIVFFIAARLAGGSTSAQKFREGGIWLTINLLLAIVVVCLAGYMKSMDRVPKAEPGIVVPGELVEPVEPDAEIAPPQ